jgi:alcohol oxidase
VRSFQVTLVGLCVDVMYRDIHGFDGPIKVSFGNYTYPVMQDFLRAAESQGIPTTDDLQDLVTGQ